VQPGDVLIAPGGAGPFLIFMTAGAIGLLAPDDVDALAFDSDLDGDGALDSVDNCPLVANVGQVDSDGCGNECDADYFQPAFRRPST
jgi:hypothetical protein